MNKIYDIVETVCTAIIAVAVLMVFVFRVVNVTGSSMENTLMEGDRVITTHFFYTPEKGDIIVTDSSNGLNKPLVKRVIATEGDKIVIDYSAGSVYVNDALMQENYIKEPMNIESKDNLEMVIPRGYIFVMGDNRNVSQDSRSDEVGLINVDSVLGKVILRILPFSKIGTVK